MTETLTGNTRCRIQKRLFREPLLVLQVEVRHKGYDVDRLEGHYDYCTWRDAKATDLYLKGLGDANQVCV